MLPVEKFPKRWRRSAEEKGGKPSRGRRVFVGRVRAFPPRAGPRLPVLPGLWGGHPCSPLIKAWVETGRRPLPRLPSRAGRSPFTACAAEESLGRSHVGSDPGCSAAHPQASLPPPLPTVTQGSCPRHRTN